MSRPLDSDELLSLIVPRLSLMQISTQPWAKLCWALPVLSAFAPSERNDLQQSPVHKKYTNRERQLLLQLRRWLP